MAKYGHVPSGSRATRVANAALGLVVGAAVGGVLTAIAQWVWANAFEMPALVMFCAFVPILLMASGWLYWRTSEIVNELESLLAGPDQSRHSDASPEERLEGVLADLRSAEMLRQQTKLSRSFNWSLQGALFCLGAALVVGILLAPYVFS